MKRKVPHKPSLDEIWAGSDAALERAGLRARAIAARTGTPLIIYRTGKIVREFVSSKRLPAAK